MRNWKKQEESFRWKPIPALRQILRGLAALLLISRGWRGESGDALICLLTLALLSLPSVLQRRLRIVLPEGMELLLLLFITAAELFGEVQGCYLTIPLWDDALHTVSGFLFAVIGYGLVWRLNSGGGGELSPILAGAAAFCFSMTVGALWELFEWGMDLLFGFDMQKDTLIQQISSVCLNPQGENCSHTIREIADAVVVFRNGESFRMGLGGYLDVGLHDTMGDLLENLLGAAVFAAVLFLSGKTPAYGWLKNHLIPRIADDCQEER